jgi:hypothetical protein
LIFDGSSGAGIGVAASGAGLSPNIEQAAVSMAADTTTIAVAGIRQRALFMATPPLNSRAPSGKLHTKSARGPMRIYQLQG